MTYLDIYMPSANFEHTAGNKIFYTVYRL